ncbi:aquaporin Z [Solicola sp. PLA-1-18]|uniref:aquaporin Z n=1 Tax=Solicola sp. PLA-1-18 TaxID=3380532 RepID=UPI003B77A10F
MTTTALSRRLGAEAPGTFWLVLGGCGAAVLAGDQIGFAGIAAAFGLTVLTAAYALGHISGGHFNPAVTVGLAVAGRFAWKDVPGYVVAQVVAAAVAGGVLLSIASGKDGFTTADGFATNGYGSMSPDGYGLLAVAICEIVLTAMFVAVILGVTAKGAPAGFGPAAIGLALTLIHLVSIPVSNTSVNPARSLGVAFYAGSGPLSQVWLFIVAPLVGAAVAGVLYRAVNVGPHSQDAGAEAR